MPDHLEEYLRDPPPEVGGEYLDVLRAALQEVLKLSTKSVRPAESQIERRYKRARDEAQERFENFRIQGGIITSGKQVVQEFRLTSAERKGAQLQGKAIWHEDVHDPGDCCLVNVRLKLENGVLQFSYFPEGEETGSPVVLRRKAP